MARPSRFLQENILTLLCYDENAKIIAAVVNPKNFDGDYGEIAARAIGYINQYGKPPKDHVADLMEDKLNDKDPNKAEVYRRILEGIKSSYEGLNKQYVMDKLMAWVRQQELKQTILDCAEYYQSDSLSDDTEELVAKIENRLAQGLKKQTNIFDPGTFLGSAQSLDFLHNPVETFPTGVKELDKFQIGPTRKELFVFLGLAKAGKSAALAHMARFTLMQRYKVCHVTLELSEKRMSQRYYQSFFGMPKRRGQYSLTNIELDELNRVTGLKRVALNPAHTLEDHDIDKFLASKMAAWGQKFGNLVIKEFPDGTLTMPMLKAYLDGMEAHAGFVPDLLIVDYADKMKLDAKNYRHDISQIYVNLRGLGVERNMAILTASQANRAGVGQDVIDSSNVAEAWDKIAIADTVITYSQTRFEKEFGVARLYVSNNRNDKDGFTVLITQNYAYSQFCLKSAPMVYQDHYLRLIKGMSAGADE